MGTDVPGLDGAESGAYRGRHQTRQTPYFIAALPVVCRPGRSPAPQRTSMLPQMLTTCGSAGGCWSAGQESLNRNAILNVCLGPPLCSQVRGTLKPPLLSMDSALSAEFAVGTIYGLGTLRLSRIIDVEFEIDLPLRSQPAGRSESLQRAGRSWRIRMSPLGADNPAAAKSCRSPRHPDLLPSDRSCTARRLAYVIVCWLSTHNTEGPFPREFQLRGCAPWEGNAGHRYGRRHGCQRYSGAR